MVVTREKMKQEEMTLSSKNQLVGADENHSISSPPISAVMWDGHMWFYLPQLTIHHPKISSNTNPSLVIPRESLPGHLRAKENTVF